MRCLPNLLAFGLLLATPLVAADAQPLRAPSMLRPAADLRQQPPLPALTPHVLPPPAAAATPCAVHRGVMVIAGAVGGALAGWFTYRVVTAGGEGSRDAERAVMAGGAILGAVLAWWDPSPPLMPARCRREP